MISAIENSSAYSVRVIREANRYYAHITLEEEVYGKYVYEIPNFVHMIGGIDINVDRVSVVITDRSGNFLDRKTFYCHELEYVRSGKREYIIHEVIKEVFSFFKSRRVECIVIEKLNFSQDMDTNRRLNRIKSNFTYSQLHEGITRKSLRNSIDIKVINPAYTSQIGEIKYCKMYGLSRHESSAYVIARRGLGYSEKIPGRILRDIPVLIERLCKELKDAKEAVKDKIKKQIEVLKNWKKYSPIETKHKWKLWALISKLSAVSSQQSDKNLVSGFT